LAKVNTEEKKLLNDDPEAMSIVCLESRAKSSQPVSGDTSFYINSSCSRKKGELDRAKGERI